MNFVILEQEAYVIYGEYVILQFRINKKQLYLVDDRAVFLDNSNSIIQKKLYREYLEHFELRYAPCRVLQVNIQNYLYKVRRKIDSGFKRYSELLTENNLFVENTGFLKIEVDNAFSLSELNILLNAYDQLYSIISCVWEEGYEYACQKKY